MVFRGAGCSSRGGALTPPVTDSPPATEDTLARAAVQPEPVQMVPPVVAPTVPEALPSLEPDGRMLPRWMHRLTRVGPSGGRPAPVSVRPDDPRNVPAVMESRADAAANAAPAFRHNLGACLGSAVTGDGLLMIGVVPFVVRNGGYRWCQKRLMVSEVRLLLLVEAYCGVGVLSHNPSGRAFEPHPPHP